MSLSDRLDELRRDVPGCALVSFGDISTGLALRTSASRQHKQDYLEEVMQQAARNFALSDTMSKDNDMVVVATPDEVRIFVRSSAGNSDVLCCVCDSVAELDHVARAAQRILTDMSRAA